LTNTATAHQLLTNGSIHQDGNDTVIPIANQNKSIRLVDFAMGNLGL
jgi:hypothetical protein